LPKPGYVDSGAQNSKSSVTTLTIIGIDLDSWAMEIRLTTTMEEIARWRYRWSWAKREGGIITSLPAATCLYEHSSEED